MISTTFLDFHINKNIKFDEAWIYSVNFLKDIEKEFRDIFERFNKFITSVQDKKINPAFGFKIRSQYNEAKEGWNNMVLKIMITLTSIASGNIVLEKRVEKFLELIIQ